MAAMERAETGRDGFVIRSHEDGSEIDFIACTKDGRMRDKVEMGLLMRVDPECFYFEDTRWAPGA
jgi:hypothetical protein